MHRAKKALLAVFATFCAISLSANAAIIGTVTDAINIRQAPGTDSISVGRLYPGDKVEIKGEKNNWYIIDRDGQERYISADYVATSEAIESPKSFAISNKIRGLVTVDLLNIRQEPDTSSAVMAKLVKNDVVDIIEISGEWYKIGFGDNFGYVFGEYVSADRGRVPVSRSIRSREREGLGIKVVEYAKKFIGVPYVAAGSSPKGFDCSGFTAYVYGSFGIELPHSSDGQAGYGTKVEKSALKAGDLVFFSYYGSKNIDHVGIYVGNGQFIHSPMPNTTVRISSMDSSYYKSNYITARRLAE